MSNHQKRRSQSKLNLARLMEEASPDSTPRDESQGDRELDSFSEAIDDYAARFGDEGIEVVDRHQANSGTILIVDDTPDNLLVLFSYLEEQEFKVLLAEDGATALEIAQAKAPDIILLDVLMPQIDGFETCHRLKANTATRDIPVIFLTAVSENKVQGFKLGGVDYITKPIEQEEVLARIQTHINLRYTRQALIQQSQTLARQNQKLQQAKDFEAVVRNATKNIRDSLDEKQILETATQELVQVLDLSSCQIELYNAEQTTATIQYEHTVTLPSSQGISRNLADFSELYEQLLQKNHLQLVESIPEFNPQGIQVSRLACPIFDDRGIMGNLWGLRPPNEVFTALEIRLMQQIADQCAIAIRQARLHEATNRQVEELAKLNQLKDDFLKTISHELKTPMSSIQLATQTMEKLLASQHNPHKSPVFQRVIQIFHKSCDRQKQLVDDLLTLCHIDAKAQTVQPELIDLHLWLPEIIQLYSKLASHQEQELILAFAQKPLEIFVDPTILERVVREFLHNACKYTPPGEKITIQTEDNESSISLYVINTGVEIPVEERKLIFNQFYRIPNNDPWHYGGTGLGLALVKRLAVILSATVDVQSGNQQTMFCIRFDKPEAFRVNP